MMKRCLDEGMIQSYLDGELPPESTHAAAAHLAQCDACAGALAAAEADNAFFATSFAPDAGLAVPTEILRARVSAAVAQLEATPEADARQSRGRNLGALLAPLSGLLSYTPQRAAAFAGVLAVVALASVFFAVRRQTTPHGDTPRQVARGERPAPRQADAAVTNVEPGEVAEGTPVNEAKAEITKPSPFVKASAPRRARAHRRPAPSTASTVKAEGLVPGEKNYREAIASLEKVVAAEGGAVLNQSARIEYERNIAVLDRAIEETRRVALRNPRDKDAAGFLLTAYQSKVELLSAVADQSQVAAIGR